MEPHQNYKDELPLKGNLTLLYVLSIMIAILMAFASVAGLLYGTISYPTEELQKAFVPADVTILFIGFPLLIVSLWLTRGGKLIGLLLWPGALFYTLYNYLAYILAMPLNVIFLVHLALVALSTYTLILLLASLNVQAVRHGLAGVVPERLSGAILAGMGTLFFLRAFGILVGSIVNHTPITTTEVALNTTDYLIAPAWIASGITLWRRDAFGYVTGLGLLFQASMLFVGLIIIMLLQPFLTGAPIVLVDVVVVFAMGLISFVPFALFIRGVMSYRNS